MTTDREIVLKSLVGSHNYNLATEQSDKDYKVFVVPTFEDLYTGKEYSKLIITDTEDNDIHDIRKLSKFFFKSNLNFLEVLASTEIELPDGNPEIEEIFSMKEDIFRMNLPYLYNACGGMHKNKMNLLSKGTEGTQHLVEEFGYDTKQAQHAYRCLKVIEDYAKNEFEHFDEVIKYSGEDKKFMMDIRNGVFEKEVFENFIKHYHDSTFVHLKELYHSFEPNLELKSKIDGLIMQLVKRKLK
ncbi:hypothetical protein FKN04_22840 [Bacillus glycinifermentans]|uniref:DNA polymerase beta superfamily protein n=1 Tax=Bacillus TaxID=1386 RepID=UPI0015824AAF|nr:MULTISPECIES: nucleotidyltransferase domain-containing protein [Bacillus]NUJ19372.1 hypothetical protein [Bacillus glycinifermentans]GIN67108.1 hypothetical protein J41TS2_25290 [Bacillus sonorensis]